MSEYTRRNQLGVATVNRGYSRDGAWKTDFALTMTEAAHCPLLACSLARLYETLR